MAKEIGKFNCTFENCLTDADGSLVLSLRVPKGETFTAKQTVAAIRTGLASGKERLTAAVAWYKETRSLNANAYFHLLVGRIAEVMNLGADEVKVKMVLDYGAIATECGDPVIVALPKTANVTDYYTYARWISDFTTKNGKQVQTALFKAHASIDDLKILMLKNFVIRFESGVIVIRHWRMHNTLRKDRYTPTNFQDELQLLGLKESGEYVLGCQTVAERLPQVKSEEVREDKVRLDKGRLEEDAPQSVAASDTRFKKPTLEEITAYCTERKNSVDPQAFFDFYESKGWRVGNQPMKDWKACVRTWERREQASGSGKPATGKANGDKYKRED